MFIAPELGTNCGYYWKNNVDDKVEDDTIPLEPVTRKETLIASRTFHNFMVQFKKTTPELLDVVRKVRDIKLQLDLNFNKKIKHNRIIYH